MKTRAEAEKEFLSTILEKIDLTVLIYALGKGSKTRVTEFVR